MSLKRTTSRDVTNCPCDDCGVLTTPPRGKSEYYMVHDEIWQEARGWQRAPLQFLCISCLEQRLGRRLKPTDFTDVAINTPSQRDTSRLANRKGA